MILKGPEDLRNFLIGNGIVGICPEAQNLVACMDMLARMCACDPPQAKQAKLNQCKQYYIGFASRASSLSPTLLSKANDGIMDFYINNQMIASIRR